MSLEKPDFEALARRLAVRHDLDFMDGNLNFDPHVTRKFATYDEAIRYWFDFGRDYEMYAEAWRLNND